MDILTEASTQLDAQTIEELQPPCGWNTDREGECNSPATMIIDFMRGCCDARKPVLYCQPHVARLIEIGRVRCLPCGETSTAIYIVSVERI